VCHYLELLLSFAGYAIQGATGPSDRSSLFQAAGGRNSRGTDVVFQLFQSVRAPLELKAQVPVRAVGEGLQHGGCLPGQCNYMDAQR
jgi:hypothetical protein